MSGLTQMLIHAKCNMLLMSPVRTGGDCHQQVIAGQAGLFGSRALLAGDSWCRKDGSRCCSCCPTHAHNLLSSVLQQPVQVWTWLSRRMYICQILSKGVEKETGGKSCNQASQLVIKGTLTVRNCMCSIWTDASKLSYCVDCLLLCSVNHALSLRYLNMPRAQVLTCTEVALGTKLIVMLCAKR